MKRLLFILALVLAGCASTGTGVTATEANILQGTDATVQVARTLYEAGKLNDTQAQAVIDMANAVVAAVQAARSSAAAGDAATSAAKLRQAADALDALNAAIAARKGG